MAKITLRNGTFNLPAANTSISFVLTLNGGTGGGTATITDPNGNPWLAAELGQDDTMNLSGINRADLIPGKWTVALTGDVTGAITRT